MNKITINDIFRLYKNNYFKKYSSSIHPVQEKAFYDIINCRTSVFGGRILKCNHCNEVLILYNSCKNRHCPQCMNVAKEKWLLAKKNYILPIKYYHTIFTLPHILNNLIYSNQKKCFDL